MERKEAGRGKPCDEDDEEVENCFSSNCSGKTAFYFIPTYACINNLEGEKNETKNDPSGENANMEFNGKFYILI